jgi:hypothetical protein
MSPVMSRSQYKKMYARFNRGEISRSELNEWLRGVDYSKLPARKRKERAPKRGRR